MLQTSDQASRISAYRLTLGVALAVGIAWCGGLLVRVDAGLDSPFGLTRFIELRDGEARPSLELNPLDGGGYRALAQEAQGRGDMSRAMTLYRIAVRRDPRDWRARARLFNDALVHGRVEESAEHLDAMLRVAPELQAPMLHALIRELWDPQLRKEVVARLAGEPPWGGVLLSKLGDPSLDPELRVKVMDDLAALRPLTPSELSMQIHALGAVGRSAEARILWLKSLPNDQRALGEAVFDGDFEEAEPIGGEFAWTWDSGAGVDLSLEGGQAASGNQWLRIDFSGRAIALSAPSQRLVLPTGHYVLSSAFEDRTNASRPFMLSVTCSSGGLLGRVELAAGKADAWKRVQSEFDVPAGCAEQRLSLAFSARSRADAQIAGVLRLDDVAIRNSLP